MKRVAFVGMAPLSAKKPYTSLLMRYSAYALRKYGMRCEFFSLSNRTAMSNVFGFRQHEIESEKRTGSELSVSRYIDLANLFLLGQRPSVERISQYDKLLEQLAEYNPDIIMANDVLLAKLISKYIDIYGKEDTKVICYVDSSSGVPAEIEDTLYWLKASGANPAQIHATKLLKRRYIEYHLSYYRMMLELSSAFLVPGDSHKPEMDKDFPRFKDKIFSLYVEWYKPRRLTRKEIKKRIKTILFIGSYTHTPNAIAIRDITERIAPKLPDKEFIIFGVGCPNKRAGNVRFIDGSSLSSGPILKRADICLSPTTSYTSGIKIKVSDYIKANKIIIGTRQGLLGYSTRNRVNCIVEDDIEKYPERISVLERDKGLMEKIQKNAHTLLDGCSKEDAMKKWGTILKHMYGSGSVKDI